MEYQTSQYQYATEPHKIVASTVIRHFDCPRREARKMTRFQSLHARHREKLTPDERAEIGQTVALVLLSRNAFDRFPRLKAHRLRIWRESFIASRIVIQRLRSTCAAHEELSALNTTDSDERDASEILPLPALPHPDAQANFEHRLRGKTRAALRLIRAAFNADKSRKRKAARNAARNTLRFCLTGVLPSARLHDVRFPSDEARRFAVWKFQLYLSRGIAAMNSRELPTQNFRSFAQVCEAMDAGQIRITNGSPRLKLKAA